MRFVLTAVGVNKPGVLAQITRRLAEKGANILDISQKILSDVYALFLIAELEDSGNFKELKEDIEAMSERLGAKIVLFEESLLRYMHRI